PGVVTGHGVASIFPLDEETIQELAAQIAACVEEALARLEEMRTVEGRSLAAEMHVLASGISEKAEQLQVLTERSRPAYALRLRARLEELLGDSRSGAVLEPARLAQEAALLAERAD